MKNFSLLFLVCFLLSCSEVHTHLPGTKKIHYTPKDFVNDLKGQAKGIHEDSLNIHLDKCLIKYKKRYPKKYAEFDQILDDKARANFLKNDSKFRKIWREPGLPGKNFGKKELNAILHIKKKEQF